MAEFGVIMMLFSIGLSLNPRTLWDMRHRLLGLGRLQLGLTAGGVMLSAMALGYTPVTGLFIGLILALSSTATMLQTLSEPSLFKSQIGRSIFAVLLTQNIAVIPILVLLPLLSVQQSQLQPNGSLTSQPQLPLSRHTIQLPKMGLAFRFKKGCPHAG